MDFPSGRFRLPTVSSIGDGVGLFQRVGAVGGIPSTGAWPANNRAIYVPFALAMPFKVSKVWWANGTTANANIDCGVYTGGGTLLGAIGSTAQAGTSVVQSAALSLFLLPGAYYMALLLSSTAGTIFRGAVGPNNLQLAGIAQQAVGATALPATATFASAASSYLPWFGVTSAAVI